jgi:hypothetical protein
MARRLALALLFLCCAWWAGQATYYADGVFERVWEYRSLHMPACSDCVGFAAMASPSDLGRRIWVSNGREWVGPLYVVDCAASADRAAFLAQGRIVELPWWLAVDRWAMAGPIQVYVSYVDPQILPGSLGWQE